MRHWSLILGWLLHWGFSTPELRARHFWRWHGKVPSRIWEHAVDGSRPVLVPFAE